MATKEGTAFLDLLIETLREHEKSLDNVLGRLEKILETVKRTEKQNMPKEFVVDVKATEEEFTDTVADFLMHLPKGYNFEIPKIGHTAYVKITYTEPNPCSPSDEEKCWEKVFKDEDL